MPRLVLLVATLVGAIPGALPPLIGWAAAHGTIALGGWTLFSIVFLWQIPHFMAIAWMYRDDYRSAGFPMLAVIEPDCRRTGRHAVLFAAALLPVTLRDNRLPGSAHEIPEVTQLSFDVRRGYQSRRVNLALPFSL